MRSHQPHYYQASATTYGDGTCDRFVADVTLPRTASYGYPDQVKVGAISRAFSDHASCESAELHTTVWLWSRGFDKWLQVLPEWPGNIVPPGGWDVPPPERELVIRGTWHGTNCEFRGAVYTDWPDSRFGERLRVATQLLDGHGAQLPVGVAGIWWHDN
jgi:hypothetical protein